MKNTFITKYVNALATKGHNMHDWIIGFTHQSWSIIFDEMLMDGVVTQEERIALSGCVSQALKTFNACLAEQLPDLRNRARWEQAPDTPFDLVAPTEAVELAESDAAMFSRSVDLSAFTNKSVDSPLCFTDSTQERVAGWLVMYGNSTEKDLDGDYFNEDTQGMLDIFNVTKALPFLYHHGGDGTTKGVPIGIIDTIEQRQAGLWYEAQLDKSNRYFSAIQQLVKDNALGTSSGALPRSVIKSRQGYIKAWSIYEGSATPTPTDPRQRSHPVSLLEKAIAETDTKGAADASVDVAKAISELDLLLIETEL